MQLNLRLATMGLALAAAACGGNPSMPMGPMGPGGTAGTPLSATWVGSGSDSTGSMMGSGTGMGSGMMGAVTWQLAQSGDTFQGTMTFSGYHGGATMTVSGVVDGKTGTFTMTMPAGSMPMAQCLATGSGTFDMDDLMDQIHGTYTGTNSCSGPFTQGQITLTKR